MTYNSSVRELFLYIVIYSVIAVLSHADAEETPNYELGYRRASKDPRNLTSPNFPDPYPSNASKIWWIYSNYLYSDIHIRFVFLDIEDSDYCENDNLTIFQYNDGLEKIVQICGNSTTYEKLELGNDVIVVFKTNNNTEKKGFVLEYYMVERDDGQDRDNYHQQGYSSNWGTVVIITFAITAAVLIAVVAVACYCQRKQNNSDVQNIEFSNSIVAGDPNKTKV